MVMSIFELRKKSLAALLLAFMASAMLPACSSSEEDEGCAQDDLDCKEEEVQDLPVYAFNLREGSPY